jgi:hypothetical protein
MPPDSFTGGLVTLKCMRELIVCCRSKSFVGADMEILKDTWLCEEAKFRTSCLVCLNTEKCGKVIYAIFWQGLFEKEGITIGCFWERGPRS